jgi:hypothetical protein
MPLRQINPCNAGAIHRGLNSDMPAGKPDSASLDSPGSWDKVATSTEKSRNDAGRK